MKGNSSDRVTPLMISAMRIACSSLSITHGPAIRKRSPAPMRISPTWKEVVIPRDLGHCKNTRRFIPSCNFVSLVVILSARDPLRSMEHLHLDGFPLRLSLLPMLVGRPDKRPEQRMRFERLRLEFGMELAPDKVRMIGQLHHLDISPVRS